MKTKDIKSIINIANDRKTEILANANALADRIINKAILEEERNKQWENRKNELKEKADKQRKEAAIKKRELKAEKRLKINSTIPKNKDTSAKQKQIDNAINKKHDEKISKIKNKYEDWTPKQQTLTKEQRNSKKLINIIRHKELKDKDKIKHTTKEERIQSAEEARKNAYLAYKAEMQRQASEIEADPQGYQNRLKKRSEAEQTRLNMLAEKRQKRLEKLQKVEITQKQKTLKDIEHFKLAQKRRNEKKIERRKMYLTKGGKLMPKVKNEVEVRPIVEQPNKQTSNKHRYLVRTQYINQPVTGDRVGAITCLTNKLKDIIKYSFNKMMERESDILVGYFVYDSDNPDVCIMEMVNSKYREINGVTTTRLQAKDVA